MIMQEEILDIVNEHDQVIGTIKRANAVGNAQVNIRIVLAFLVDQDGRIGLLKRTAHKTPDPLAWALVGGCVSSGEDYDAAIVREIAEEVNLYPADYQISLFGYYSPQMGWAGLNGLGLYKKIYQVKVNRMDIVYNTDDFCQIWWQTAIHFVESENTERFAQGVIWLLKQSYFTE
jgi:8-oxo-dGTP pyrophosphatase MutT (NUDIX family)